ncbi:MAG: LysM peptidoglycan-binding domain-containing protein [Verrucomicrobiota bacterium]
MRAPILVVAVVAVHIMAVSAVVCIQGCGTTKRAGKVEPPPTPVMPPKTETGTPTVLKPSIQPPVAVEPAPSMAVPAESRTYAVQNGDSLSKIASRFGVSSREIAELNGIKDANKIRVGQKIVLPEYAKPVPPGAAPVHKKKAAKPEAAPAAAVPEGGNAYVVQAGDNLSKIASRHGIKLGALREANQLKGDKIMVGQKLIIPTSRPLAPESLEGMPAAAAPKVEMAPPPMPAPAEPKVSSQDQPLDYTVQPGDSLESIAKLFLVRQDDLMKLNGISDAASVKPGQKLRIPPTAL